MLGVDEFEVSIQGSEPLMLKFLTPLPALKSPWQNTNSIAFTSALSQYINFGNNIQDDSNTALSWTFWVNPSAFTVTNTVIAKINSSNQGWFLFFDGTTFGVFYSHSPDALWVEAGTFLISTWYFIAVTLDGTGTAAGTKIYVNGSLQTNNVRQNDLSGSVLTSIALSMGADLAGGGNTPEQFLAGNLTQVAHWNTVLSGANITSLYNSGAPNNPLSQSFAANCDHFWPLGTPNDAIAAGGILDRVGSVNGTPINSPVISSTHP